VLFVRGISPVQNWWRNLLGKDISCSQWEGPSMHSRCLAFFPLRVFLGCGGGERNYFHVSLVPNVFSMGSHQIPNMFPNMFSIHTSLLSPHTLANVVCLSPIAYTAGPKGRTSILQNRTWSDWEFIVCQNEITKIRQTCVEFAKVLWWLKKLLKSL